MNGLVIKMLTIKESESWNKCLFFSEAVKRGGNGSVENNVGILFVKIKRQRFILDNGSAERCSDK